MDFQRLTLRIKKASRSVDFIPHKRRAIHIRLAHHQLRREQPLPEQHYRTVWLDDTLPLLPKSVKGQFLVPCGVLVALVETAIRQVHKCHVAAAVCYRRQDFKAVAVYKSYVW